MTIETPWLGRSLPVVHQPFACRSTVFSRRFVYLRSLSWELAARPDRQMTPRVRPPRSRVRSTRQCRPPGRREGVAIASYECSAVYMLEGTPGEISGVGPESIS